MYNLKQFGTVYFNEPLPADWDGKVYCTDTNAAMTLRTNETHGYLAAYTFTLVTQGRLDIVYNGRELTLHTDDLYLYSPGLPVTVVAASDDYRGICLLADEHVTFETPVVHDLVRLAYLPIVHLHEPKLTLPHEAALRLARKMREIIDYLHSTHIYKHQILRMLYSVFLLDLQDVQDQAIDHRQVPQRVEEIFMGFIRLLPDHFAEHHDIGFYAGRLNISTVYLSRVVRQVTGRTVIDYVNQTLLMEASFLLATSQMSIAQIADRLHFASQSSFCKFFTRMKGVPPRAYRS